MTRAAAAAWCCRTRDSPPRPLEPMGKAEQRALATIAPSRKYEYGGAMGLARGRPSSPADCKRRPPQPVLLVLPYGSSSTGANKTKSIFFILELCVCTRALWLAPVKHTGGGGGLTTASHTVRVVTSERNKIEIRVRGLYLSSRFIFMLEQNITALVANSSLQDLVVLPTNRQNLVYCCILYKHVRSFSHTLEKRLK